MKTLLLTGFAVLCVLEIVVTDGEREDCIDKEKMKGKIEEMKERKKAMMDECKEANSDKKEIRKCIREKIKQGFESRNKDKSFDDIIAEKMEYVLPDKKEQVEQAGKECAAENENSENKYRKFRKCWFKKVSEFCKSPFGRKWKKGGSEEEVAEE